MTESFRPKHLSVSSVELYARCPAQYRLRYVDGIKTPSTVQQAWGTAFHAALEAGHHGEDAAVAWLRFWNAARDDLARRNLDLVPGKQHGVTLLDEYEERGLAVQCPSEVRFMLPFPGGRIPVQLLGFIDAVTPYEMREYKTTSGRWWSETKAQLAHQTHVYGWAHQRLYRRRSPIRYVIFGTRSPTVTEYLVEPSPDGFRVFEQLAEGVWNGIAAGRFDGCGSCNTCAPAEESSGAGASMFDWGEI